MVLTESESLADEDVNYVLLGWLLCVLAQDPCNGEMISEEGLGSKIRGYVLGCFLALT